MLRETLHCSGMLNRAMYVKTTLHCIGMLYRAMYGRKLIFAVLDPTGVPVTGGPPIMLSVVRHFAYRW